MASNDPAEKPQIVRRNFRMMTLSYILWRIGWIFKTESVIIPGFLDSFGASAATRGWMVVLNRIGQSVPQFLFAHHIANLSRLKAWYCALLLMNALPWIVLAAMVPKSIPEQGRDVILWAFIIGYTVYWFLYGTARILERSVMGKIIPFQIRGRLFGMSGFAGGLMAVVGALFLMPEWLRPSAERYDLLFWFIAACFGLSGAVNFWLLEPPRSESAEGGTFRFRDTLRIFRENPEFRKFLVCAMLLSCILLLFPHFVVLGQTRLGLKGDKFAIYVVVQNVSMAVFAAIGGWLADRYGNRRALQLTGFILCAVPVGALVLAGLGPAGKALYPITFALIGCTPVSQTILNNYVLELAPETQHPQYLASLQLVIIVPLLFSPLVGKLIDLYSFEAVFLGCNALILAGALMTFWLAEPRHGKAD